MMRPIEEKKIEDWMALYMEENKNSNIELTRIIFSDFKKSFGNLKPNDISEVSMTAFLDEIQKRRKYCLKTMDTKKWLLNRFMGFLQKNGVIEHNPLRVRKYHAIYDDKFEAESSLTPEEVAKLLAEIKKYSPGFFYPIVLFASETAAKKFELVNLKWDQLDLVHGFVKFPGGEFLDARRLKMSDELVAILKNLPRRSDEHVFTTHNGKVFSKKRLTHLANQFSSKIDFDKNWTFQTLRSSLAHQFLRSGGEKEKLRSLLGIKDIGILDGLVSQNGEA